MLKPTFDLARYSGTPFLKSIFGFNLGVMGEQDNHRYTGIDVRFRDEDDNLCRPVVCFHREVWSKDGNRMSTNIHYCLNDIPRDVKYAIIGEPYQLKDLRRRIGILGFRLWLKREYRDAVEQFEYAKQMRQYDDLKGLTLDDAL